MNAFGTFERVKIMIVSFCPGKRVSDKWGYDFVSCN
jgi:hypothetical protein